MVRHARESPLEQSSRGRDSELCCLGAEQFSQRAANIPESRVGKVGASQKIFISYVEEDGAVSHEIAAGLESQGYSSWYYERDCPAGADYFEETFKAISDCEAMIVLISPRSLADIRRPSTDKCPEPPIRLDIRRSISLDLEVALQRHIRSGLVAFALS
ncbi:MAG: toll/interleukin-1 receptor domain-containing protein [Candidatus Acidiferrales bacterium]